MVIKSLFKQTTVDGVEGLIKRQDDFENRLNAQKDRLSSFDVLADKYISEKHPESVRCEIKL